jgi:hypothetical protein
MSEHHYNVDKYAKLLLVMPLPNLDLVDSLLPTLDQMGNYSLELN